MDQTGNEYEQAAAITDSLETYGCLTGGYPTPQPDEITESPVFQAMRRATDFYMMVRRQELLSYSVDADGVAQLRFRRKAWGFTGADAFAGIAPPGAAIPSGELVEGEGYIVRGTSGGVSYAGGRYAPGERFTAGPSSEYTSDGDAAPWVYDGIRHAALRKGWSNEWVCVMQTHVFKEAYDSLWKPEVYADFFGFGERALFMLPSAPVELIQHANTTTAFSVDPTDGNATFEQELTRSQFINPEAPTGYRFAAGVNASATSEERASWQIYEKPFEVSSCTLEFDGPEQVVVLTLAARPRYHANAPAVVDSDPATWSADDMARLDGTHGTEPEDYRTPDNALREWLRWAFGDHAAPSLKAGDYAHNVGAPYPTPWGNCAPTFHFVRLAREAYEDDNETVQPLDTRMLAQEHGYIEWCLRCICEGYVDGTTTQERACRNVLDAGVYDYTWENVCFESHTGRDCGPFPVSVRDDRPAGFGPLPNTKTYADTHNHLCGVANLLTRLRLDVPLEFSTVDIDYVGKKDVGLTDPMVWGYCTDLVHEVWVDGQTPPIAGTLVSTSAPTVWATPPQLQGTQSAGLTCADGGGAEWVLGNFRRDTSWTVAIATGWEVAVPSELRDLVDLGAISTLAVKTRLRQKHKRLDEDPRTACDVTPGTWQWRVDVEVDNVQTCELIRPGTVTAPLPPGGDFGEHQPPGSTACAYGSIDSATWDLLAYPGAMVEVPLVDLP